MLQNGQASETTLLKSQTEDARQLRSILRMRGGMFSLSERPLDVGSQLIWKGFASSLMAQVYSQLKLKDIFI